MDAIDAIVAGDCEDRSVTLNRLLRDRTAYLLLLCSLILTVFRRRRLSTLSLAHKKNQSPAEGHLSAFVPSLG